jgi:hypothetical protein
MRAGPINPPVVSTPEAPMAGYFTVLVFSKNLLHRKDHLLYSAFRLPELGERN